jgi:hypothetical protein
VAAVLLRADMPESAAISGGLEEAGEIFLFGIVVIIAVIYLQNSPSYYIGMLHTGSAGPS